MLAGDDGIATPNDRLGKKFVVPLESQPMPTRRDFLHTSLATGAAAALGGALSAAGPWQSQLSKPAASPERCAAPKRILILGGTSFLGPAIVEAAKARGHSLTLFNRGKTEKRIGIIEGVEKLYGNRDPKLPADETQNEAGEYTNPTPRGLESLQAKTWDAVVDTSGYYPRIVKASAELLAPNVKQYIFISSISVYADSSKPHQDEDASLETLDDPTVETMGEGFKNYGGLKALCEQAAEAALPGRVANVRPGLIVGPGDPTDRFNYWPIRIQRGGDVLAPGSPDDPVQLVDVRDLAEWLVVLIENNTTGVFNAINPAPGKLTIGETLESCKKAAAYYEGTHHRRPREANLIWVPADFLEQHKVTPWGDMPLWLPPTGESAGSHLRSNTKAVAAGLKFRPVQETAAGILEWWPREIERRKRITAQLKEEAKKAGKPEPQVRDPEQIKEGISPEREVKVLEAWRATQNP
ncbi:MAG: NAD-dependent epimerase/dehydratase family protein [Phycisphaerales bacterium]|nr:NAD-dependent epimerase/dehydratase family protein [Phycisphaerales bacterium]